jgi:hypothetical protein
MSRSYRKHDIIANCGRGGGSEKYDKRLANRSLRHNVTRLLHVDPEQEILPVMREVSDKWDMNKDGKSYFGDFLSEANYNQHHNSVWITELTSAADWLERYRSMKNK